MATVTKRDLVSAVAETCGCQQNTARDAVQALLDQIIEELSSGNRIELRDFGVFETRTRDAHQARNPRTRETVDVPPRASVKFKAGRVMKDKIQVLARGTSEPGESGPLPPSTPPPLA
jgi:nucleoid DNA-binding protein